MAPNSSSSTILANGFHTDDVDSKTDIRPKEKAMRTEQPIIWFNVIFITLFHLIACLSVVCGFMRVKLITILYGLFVGGVGGFGVTGGVHRLWSHRSYKAKWPLRLILLFCYSVSGQNSVYDWVRDHRVHHKFSETDADPHNAKRGFFFAHVGWLMCRKHPQVTEKGKSIDLSDVLDDPLVRFHQAHFVWIKLVCCFILPVLVPYYCFGESLVQSILVLNFVRYILNLNFTWLVNSAAHIWGNKPFDTRIMPAENPLVSFVALGEGWHNYHHVFPWDYKAAELGNYSLNITTLLIDLFAKIGWAYDLKQPSKDLVQRTAMKHGDGSRHFEVGIDGKIEELDANQNDVDVPNRNLEKCKTV